MWRPVLLYKYYLRPARSNIGLQVLLYNIGRNRAHTAGYCNVARAPGLLQSLRSTQLWFLPLLKPCGICCYSTGGEKTPGHTPGAEINTEQNPESAVKPEVGKHKLTDEEFQAVQEMFHNKFRSLLMQKIKDKQSKSFYHYTENNYMSVVDAKNEYLLTDKDLIHLRTFRRSSPYDGDSQRTGVDFIEVALSKDIIKIAIRKWGSLENIALEKRRKKYFENSSPFQQLKIQTWMSTFKEAFSKENGLVVMMALIMNIVNAVCKIIILHMTGSNTVFSELIHSFADIMNQVALAIAKFLSLKRPDIDHPYGYGNFQPIMSIFCGIIFFSMGFGVSAYNAFQGFMHPAGLTPVSFTTVAQLLSVTFITEAVSLSVAVRQVRKDAKAAGLSFYRYVSKAEDPLVNVVLLEDLVGVLGVLVCGGAVGASLYFNQPSIDALGSLTIGLMMAGVSGVLFKTSTDILLGKSLWYQDKVKQVIQDDRMVNAVFDNKTIDMGDQSRLKTEIVLDAREVTRHLLDNYDVDAMLLQWKSVETVEDMERFLETFGVEYYDEIVKQIDRIEQEVKKKFPEIRHIDIEPS